jgi:hypothetical protein
MACPMLIIMLLLHRVDVPNIYFDLVYILKVKLLFMLVTHVIQLSMDWMTSVGFQHINMLLKKPKLEKANGNVQRFSKENMPSIDSTSRKLHFKVPTPICNFPTSSSIFNDLKLGQKLPSNCYPSSLSQGWWSTSWTNDVPMLFMFCK